MKKFLFLFAVAFMAACSQPTEQTSVQLSGAIENPNDQPIEFVYFQDFTNNHREIITLELDAENQFSQEFDMPEAAAGILRHGRTSIRLFLQPGDKLQLHADAANLKESLSLSGTAAADNQCFVDYQRKMEPTFSQSFFSNAIKDHDAMAFSQVMDDITRQKLDFLQQCAGNNELSEAFSSFFNTEVLYDKYTRLLAYPAMHKGLNQLQEPAPLHEGYYDFLDEALAFDDNHLNSETYVGFLFAYLNFKGQAEGSHQELSANEMTYAQAGEWLSGKSAEYIKVISINREFNYGALDKARAMHQQFLASAQSQDLIDRVNNTWQGIQSLMPGNPAPQFTVTDIDGNQVSLSDYQGKVVYLKFWASWCGPCMRQVPPAGELKRRMADQEDLVFLYVSIDTDNNAWRNTIERNNISGVHSVTPGRERGVPALYQVKWIPTFYIIGRDGNIFDNRPPQPADPNVDEVLLKALAL